jgi:hypothetical protein
MARGSFAWRRLTEYWDENRDAFNNDTTNRTNVLDLAAHYPYSPERWRIFVDGTRQFPSYGPVPQYSHDTDRHLLQPKAGETVVFESAERPRYVVAYELEATFANTMNQALTPGDRVRIGAYDGENGWYVEHRGEHAPTEVDLVVERAENVVARAEDESLEKPLTEFTRLSLQTGWYDVTRQEWQQSFAAESDATGVDEYQQQNPQIGTTAVPDRRGSQCGNVPAHFEVTASDTTTDLVLEAGSAAQVNLGTTTPLQRTKFALTTDNIDTASTWVPLRVYRIDPARDIINTQLDTVSIVEFPQGETVQVLVQAYSKLNVADANGNQLTDSNFEVLPEFNPQNNVLQTSTDVEQVANNTGTLQTTIDNPGGFQIGRDILAAGSGPEATGDVPNLTNIKRPLYADDLFVIFGKTASTGDVSYQIQFEQDW